MGYFVVHLSFRQIDPLEQALRMRSHTKPSGHPWPATAPW